MAMTGRIQRRLAAAIVLTALIPLLAAVYLARSAVQHTSGRFFTPEIGERLEKALSLYQELSRAEKTIMRDEATAIARRPGLGAAVRAHDGASLERELHAAIAKRPDLVSLTVSDGDRNVGAVDRGRPLDDAKELSLEVHRPIGVEAGDAEDVDPPDDAPALTAVFATDRARFESDMEDMNKFVDLYDTMASRRAEDEATYVRIFAGLLGLTIIAAIATGILMARGVSRRIVRLAEATGKVGAGDLSIRVEEHGSDEVTDLSRAFNRMLAEVEASRSRIEYLQRIGAWQGMARRLAHEIKNPLTPIQLAVEEIHERYDGKEPAYRRLLDATLQIVEAEVGTLRRLVTEFSDFARLPRAHLEPTDLAAFLRDQAEKSALLDAGTVTVEAAEKTGMPGSTVALSFELPDGAAPAYLDRQMLGRALTNLIRNSAQAIRDQGRPEGHVRVGLSRLGDFWILDVDDDGPGVPADQRESVFDPYVTTKHDGTGLGLAIVKKIVVEHGGVISVREAPLGGARVRVSLPVFGTAAAQAAVDRETASSPESSPRPELDAPARIGGA